MWRNEARLLLRSFAFSRLNFSCSNFAEGESWLARKSNKNFHSVESIHAGRLQKWVRMTDCCFCCCRCSVDRHVVCVWKSGSPPGFLHLPEEINTWLMMMRRHWRDERLHIHARSINCCWCCDKCVVWCSRSWLARLPLGAGQRTFSQWGIYFCTDGKHRLRKLHCSATFLNFSHSTDACFNKQSSRIFW